MVQTESAPAAIGPYSQAILTGNLVFVSGQLPLDPVSGEFAAADVAGQTRKCLENLAAILNAAGATLDDVVQTTVYLKRMDDFAAMNGVYATHFEELPPARATVAVAALPRDSLVEITAMAVLPGKSGA